MSVLLCFLCKRHFCLRIVLLLCLCVTCVLVCVCVLLVCWCDVLQICDPHEWLVKIVQLQNTGQQEEAWDQNAGEELRQIKRLQSDRRQPKGKRSERLNPVCRSVRPNRHRRP